MDKEFLSGQIKNNKGRLNFLFSFLFSSLIWFLSIPPYGFPPLVLLSLVLPLYYLKNVDKKFLITITPFLTTIFEFSSLHWITKVITKYGNLSLLVSLLLNILLCFYLGLYLYFFFIITKILIERNSITGYIYCPFVFTILEFLKARLFGGFLWWNIGYSLSLNTYLLQSVRFWGIYGLTFLGVSLNVVILYLFIRGKNKTIFVFIFSILTLTSLFIFDGLIYKKKETLPEKIISAGFIQPNIPQDVKWNKSFIEEIENRILTLTYSLKNKNLDIIVFPESSTPHEWGNDPEFENKIKDIAKEINSNLIIGTVLTEENKIYNGAIIIDRKGKEAGNYKKNHLVPFGEFIPFQKFFFFLSPIVETFTSFSSGNSLKPINLEGNLLGISICYEAVFPHLIRKEVNLKAEVLINISNDAWYKNTPALVQHFLIDRVRCVEFSRYLIRSANGGISAIINNKGEIEAICTHERECVSNYEVKLLKNKTFYSIFGDYYLLSFILVLGYGIKLNKKAPVKPGL